MVIMVKVKTACVLLMLLFSSWLSTARLHAGAEVTAISGLKASAAITSAETKKEKSQVAATDEGNSNKKHSVKLEVVRKKNGSAKSSSASSSRVSDEGFVAFNADYHAPRHHPPKNN